MYAIHTCTRNLKKKKCCFEIVTSCINQPNILMYRIQIDEIFKLIIIKHVKNITLFEGVRFPVLIPT